MIRRIWNWVFHFDGPERRHWKAMGDDYGRVKKI